MAPSFSLYTEISTRALQFNNKMQDLVSKKIEIVNEIKNHHGYDPQSILFVGFSPLMLVPSLENLFVTGITQETKKWLDTLQIKYTYISDDDFVSDEAKYDWVVAGDEYFTFAASEQKQRVNVEELIRATKRTMITTLRDYKNFDYKEREFSNPLAIRNGTDSMVFLEYHDFVDKNFWKTMVYEIQGDNVSLSGPFERCSMFFKQLAKFSFDAGAKNFYVHKNLMYKSVIKKNYEHVISISV